MLLISFASPKGYIIVHSVSQFNQIHRFKLPRLAGLDPSTKCFRRPALGDIDLDRAPRSLESSQVFLIGHPQHVGIGMIHVTHSHVDVIVM